MCEVIDFATRRRVPWVKAQDVKEETSFDLIWMISSLLSANDSENIKLIKSIRANSVLSRSSIQQGISYFESCTVDEINDFIDNSNSLQINQKPWFYVWAVEVLYSKLDKKWKN